MFFFTSSKYIKYLCHIIAMLLCCVLLQCGATRPWMPRRIPISCDSWPSSRHVSGICFNVQLTLFSWYFWALFPSFNWGDYEFDSPFLNGKTHHQSDNFEYTLHTVRTFCKDMSNFPDLSASKKNIYTYIHLSPSNMHDIPILHIVAWSCFQLRGNIACALFVNAPLGQSASQY